MLKLVFKFLQINYKLKPKSLIYRFIPQTPQIFLNNNMSLSNFVVYKSKINNFCV